MQLTESFYLQTDVVAIARQLLGKVLYTRINGELSAGIILETEAYAGITDKASHAYGNRRTMRTEIMYGAGGYAYVYLIYGMYSLFNVVTNKAGIPHAVLIRAISPFEGEELMQKRNNNKPLKYKDGVGPGKLSRLLGIDYSMTGTILQKNAQNTAIWIEDKKLIGPNDVVKVGKRIGIDYAGEDADLPYRFWIEDVDLKVIRKDY